MHGQGSGPAPALHDSPAGRPAGFCSPSGLLLCPIITILRSVRAWNLSVVTLTGVRLHRRRQVVGFLLGWILFFFFFTILYQPFFFSFFSLRVSVQISCTPLPPSMQEVICRVVGENLPK